MVVVSVNRRRLRVLLLETRRGFVDGASMRCHVPRGVKEVEGRNGFERIWACNSQWSSSPPRYLGDYRRG